MKISSKNINWSYVACSILMSMGLIISFIGLFVNFATSSETNVKLFDLNGVLGGFTITTALLSVLGATILTAFIIIAAITNKEQKVTPIIFICITLFVSIAFAILSASAGIALSETTVMYSKVKYNLTSSSYLIFFGTIVSPLLYIANKMFR